MIRPHRPVQERTSIIKSAEPRSRLRRPGGERCVVCGAALRSGHGAGDLVCDCHAPDGYQPRCDARLDERILVLLYRAAGRPLNLYRALGCDASGSNRMAVLDAVRRLNDSGMVAVRGHKGIGYEMLTTAHRRRVK